MDDPSRFSRPTRPAPPRWLGPLLMAAGGLILAVVALAAFGFGAPASGLAGVSPPRVGQPLGNFTLSDLNGRQVSLSDYAGRPVLINAWATWCPPCRAEMPALLEYFQSHQAEGLVVLAINGGEDPATAAGFARSNGLTFPVLLDPVTRLLDRMAIYSYPTTILVGRDGVVRAIHIGMLNARSLADEITPWLAK